MLFFWLLFVLLHAKTLKVEYMITAAAIIVPTIKKNNFNDKKLVELGGKLIDKVLKSATTNCEVNKPTNRTIRTMR